MCGLAGIIFGKKRRTVKERQHLLDIFTRLLVLSEARGHHATGVAWVKTDNTFDLFKEPMPASEFVHESRYTDLLAGVDNKTTILMGHTRWRTQGTEFNNGNNHPIMVSNAIITHNGHISNAESLFRRFRFQRQAEVDSEILAHFASQASQHCRWDVQRLQERLSRCHGTMAIVQVSTAIPDMVLLARVERPLHLVYNKACRAHIYSSDIAYLEQALQDSSQWSSIYIPRARIFSLTMV